MSKDYEKPRITVLFLQDEIVRTSMVNDEYDDGYQDPNIQFKG